MSPRFASCAAAFAMVVSSCLMDQAPAGLRRTPAGPGATVRFDLAHEPLPDIPLPNDTATWPDPTSRTGLRVNASLVAPTSFEAQARDRLSRMEGWSTFAPISVSFDLDRSDPAYARYDGAALDLLNIVARHRGDDYEFADDAVYLLNLTTGVPVPLDLGAGNFDYTLKRLDAYWANDTRVTERNLLFETIDETRGGAVTRATFTPADDSDFDGVLDQPNLDDPAACPGPDPVCDGAGDPHHHDQVCLDRRRDRDRCIDNHLLTYYERETDTLLLRPLVPLDEMTRYAVVVTDRTRDGKGNAVRSPFDLVYHASQEGAARRAMDILNDPKRAAYFGDIAGKGLDHVAFLWSFTTQPTVADLLALRDGLHGHGPFARWADQYPPSLELNRAVGLVSGVLTGDNVDPPGWETSLDGAQAGCHDKLGNLFVLHYADLRPQLRALLTQGFGMREGPGVELLLKTFEDIDHMVVGTYSSPFLLEGGPQGGDPSAAFDLDFAAGAGFEDQDTVQLWLVVPKQTAAHQQPFDVVIYGHGYTGDFSEMLLYAGNMAAHGIATIGVNAVGHGLVLTDPLQEAILSNLLSMTCAGPFYDAITQSRARDLDGDGTPDSGGDLWSSYAFHTRDAVRQSVLDHLQLTRILRSFGTSKGEVLCRNAVTGWDKPASQPCDVNGDGEPDVAGDFDGDGVADVGGPDATFSTWGESLGGVLAGIHGAVDPNIAAAVPGSGGGGLTDIGVRSLQAGLVEAVLLRLFGPLLVTVPAGERSACTQLSKEPDRCTSCDPTQLSLRWVMPSLDSTGELEIGCFALEDLASTTVLVHDLDNGELKCASVNEAGRFRVGLPASRGDRVRLDFYPGAHQVASYASCAPTFADGTSPKVSVEAYGEGPYQSGVANDTGTETCDGPSCGRFQGHFYAEGAALTSPAEGLGALRQTPALRRSLALAQAALDPGDPLSFAPYYARRKMKAPDGSTMEPRALLTLNTIGDMNVPLSAGIAFARASGALPFMRPDQVARYPEHADFATPAELFAALGHATPNQVLIDHHVIEGVSALARHPAGQGCALSQNAKNAAGTFPKADGAVGQCSPTGCAAEPGACWYGTHCDDTLDRCVPDPIGAETCDEALYDVDDLDEGTALFYEQNAHEPLRLSRYAEAAAPAGLAAVWEPRLLGRPFTADLGWTPSSRKLVALLDAYIVPQGAHTFGNGEPCQSFDSGTYLTNLTARFFMTRGADIYYLSHPKTHLCLQDPASCGYLP